MLSVRSAGRRILGRHPRVALALCLLLAGLAPRAALAGFQAVQGVDLDTLSPLAVAAADLNSDGRPDVIVSDGLLPRMTVAINTTPSGSGTLTFAPPVEVGGPTNARQFAVADFDGDTRPDMATTGFSGGGLIVMRNTTATGASTATFDNPALFAGGSDSEHMVTADFNGDNKPDIAVADHDAGGAVFVALNTATTPGTLSFSSSFTTSLGVPAWHLAAADLNGDGKTDLAITAEGGTGLYVLLNTTDFTSNPSTASFTVHTIPFTGGTDQTVVASDLNGDGKPDLAVTTGSSSIAILLNVTPTGAATPSLLGSILVPVHSVPFGLTAADLNGDGRPDLAVAHASFTSSQPVTTLLNTTSDHGFPTFTAQDLTGGTTVGYSVAASDLNGNGKPDLLSVDFTGPHIPVWPDLPSGALALAAPSATVAEGGGSVAVTLKRTGGTDAQVSAILTATGGNAIQGQDYTLAGPQTVTWADGDSADKTVIIPIIQDQLDEGDETIQLTLTQPPNPFGATLGAQTTTTLTIADDDPVTLGVANASATEGSSGTSNLTFTVTRTGSTTRTATVQYATTDGSATAGTDYTSTSGTLTFATSEASKTVNVPILGDTLAEPDETFTLTLSNPTNATLGIDQAIGVILNDDGEAPRAVSIASASTIEGNAGTSSATFTVTRTGSLEQTATVQYVTADGSAKAGSDYTATTGTLSFGSNESTKTILVPILGDTLPEPDEAFTVTLSNPTNAVLGIAQAIGIIQNDDGDGVPSVNIANGSVAEGDSGTSNLTFTVTRTGSLSQTSTVQYVTADGSAKAGSDYTTTSGSLTFAPTEASKTIAVPILGDTNPEPDETFTLTLSSPTNATLGIAQAIGIIQNDDTATPPAPCTPRPRVTQTLAAGGGALNVHVESTPLSNQANNTLRQISFGTLQNATVTLNGQAVTSGQTVALPPNAIVADLVVRRGTPGQPTTVPFTVVDGCGAWQTFVGGGSAAGF